MDARFFTAWVEETARAVAADRDRLTRLDAAIGDADHGTNLDRGFTAVREALSAAFPGTPGAVLTLTGTTLIRKVGGASGPLYGTVFRQMGAVLTAAQREGPGEPAGHGPAGRSLPPSAGDAPGPEGPEELEEEVTVTLADLAAAFEAGLAGVRKLGGAQEGDKTMVDALAPATRALSGAVSAGRGAREVFDAALAAAREGAVATVPLMARKGRASYLGERSIGHEDPGAASTVLLFVALRAAAGG
ncbi:DAK2 domain-containing protein [Sphaerisporangium sp. NPDC005289]|uniref:DAK2 domain-containing protein n=1 Tax=Sphaerisporangium sp. NPDC005289 TaxID=3155247 RepID=UPI0033BEE06B